MDQDPTPRQLAPRASARVDVPLAGLARHAAKQKSAPALWSMPLRPFFLACALFASAKLPLWLLVRFGVVTVPTAWPLRLWHIHEMIFGVVQAAIAGFLLTVLPRWTQTKALGARGLAFVFLLWLVGRIAMAASAWLPVAVVACADLALPIALVYLVGHSLIRARSWHNAPIFGILVALAASAFLFHRSIFDPSPEVAAGVELGINFGLHGIGLLVAIIAGRVVPSFTRNAWTMAHGPHAPDAAEIRGLPAWDRASVVAILVHLLTIVLPAPPPLRAAAAGVAALLLVARMRFWGTRKATRLPLIWILHLGHLWLVIAFVLSALHQIFPSWPRESAVHALNIGCMGSMILGMMVRASLGHTGRELRASAPVIAAFALINFSALLRLVATIPGISAQVWLVSFAGAAFSCAFMAYAWAFFAVLTQPPLQPSARKVSLGVRA
jgi:uncharacterized protein involved in response to NO